MGITSYGTISYSPTTPPQGLLGLHVDGTHLKDSDGNIVVLRGVSDSSTTWLDYGINDENQFIYMQAWGCNAVRVTVADWDIRAGCLTDPNFWAGLDNVINWAGAHGLYVILNGFHPAGTCPHGYLAVDCAHYMTVDFPWASWIAMWQQYATRYKDKTNILYELMSEPIDCDYATYQTQTRACIDAIRAIDPDCVIFVHAVDATTAYDCTFAFESSYPISRPNIVYTYHVYSFNMAGNTKSAIQNRIAHTEAYTLLSSGKCVMPTEFGPGGNGAENNWEPVPWTGSYDETWLNNYMDVMEADGFAGYAAWRWCTSTYDTTFNLLADWNGNPTAYGQVIRNYLLAHPTP